MITKYAVISSISDPSCFTVINFTDITELYVSFIKIAFQSETRKRKMKLGEYYYQ